MLLLIILLSTIFSKPLVPRKNILAIDCGGFFELRTSIGVKYQKDNNYTQSEQVDYFQVAEYTRPKIRYTNDYQIYMTQRQSDYEFSYHLHLNQIQNSLQKFVLILQFAELHYKERNARLFNIAIGQKIVIESLDVFAKVGAKSAYEIYLEIELDNGQLFYEGILCENIDNQITLTFIPIVDKPMIAGIMLFKGSLAETDFEEKEQQRQQWEDANKELTADEKKELRRQRAEQKELEVKEKQETIKIRNGFTHEIERQVETAKFEWPDMRFELFLMMLQTPLGAVMIVGFLTVMFVSVTFIFFDPYGYKKLNEEMAELKRRKLIKRKQ